MSRSIRWPLRFFGYVGHRLQKGVERVRKFHCRLWRKNDARRDVNAGPVVWPWSCSGFIWHETLRAERDLHTAVVCSGGYKPAEILLVHGQVVIDAQFRLISHISPLMSFGNAETYAFDGEKWSPA